eukprot:6469112-Amphidinium_carterae.4
MHRRQQALDAANPNRKWMQWKLAETLKMYRDNCKEKFKPPLILVRFLIHSIPVESFPCKSESRVSAGKSGLWRAGLDTDGDHDATTVPGRTGGATRLSVSAMSGDVH